MSSGCELVLVQPDDMRGRIPIAHMRHLYRVDEVEKRIDEIGPAILIQQVIGMYPYVERKNRGATASR